MKKLNWHIEFLALVEQRKNTPFIWGTNDCALFAADVVVLQGNKDPAAVSRGKYKTEIGAKRHLKAVYGDIQTVWDRVFDRLPNPNFVQNGDVVVFESELGTTSGIYWNGGIYAPGQDGVVYLTEHHSKIHTAWRT